MEIIARLQEQDKIFKDFKVSLSISVTKKTLVFSHENVILRVFLSSQKVNSKINGLHHQVGWNSNYSQVQYSCNLMGQHLKYLPKSDGNTLVIYSSILQVLVEQDTYIITNYIKHKKNSGLFQHYLGCLPIICKKKKKNPAGTFRKNTHLQLYSRYWNLDRYFTFGDKIGERWIFFHILSSNVTDNTIAQSSSFWNQTRFK